MKLSFLPDEYTLMGIINWVLPIMFVESILIFILVVGLSLMMVAKG